MPNTVCVVKFDLLRVFMITSYKFIFISITNPIGAYTCRLDIEINSLSTSGNLNVNLLSRTRRIHQPIIVQHNTHSLGCTYTFVFHLNKNNQHYTIKQRNQCTHFVYAPGNDNNNMFNLQERKTLRKEWKIVL